MKTLCTTILVLHTLICLAQENVPSTNSFIVTGQIKKDLNVTLDDLSKMAAITIGDFTITNHKGEVKSNGENLKGVLLKDILARLEFNTDQPKLLSEYYFTLTASDNYKVVYSWNEIFNNPAGNGIYIVVEKNGKSLKLMDDRILVISLSDFATGRRNIKSLNKIFVNRTE